MKAIQIAQRYFHGYGPVLRNFRGLASVAQNSSAAGIMQTTGSSNIVTVSVERDSAEPSKKFPLPHNVGIHMPAFTEVQTPDARSHTDNTSNVKLATEQPDMELTVHECPQSLKKEFHNLFLERDLTSSTSRLTAINIMHRTRNDMTVYNQEVAAEREVLMSSFIEAARSICADLIQAGYWADFIDPHSGTPHLGPHTNDTLFETDPRNRYFGIDIEDLGCCKVIQHKEWGRHAFVGIIFTDAPPTEVLLK